MNKKKRKKKIDNADNAKKLQGIWKDLPKRVIKELVKKDYGDDAD